MVATYEDKIKMKICENRKNPRKINQDNRFPPINF